MSGLTPQREMFSQNVALGKTGAEAVEKFNQIEGKIIFSDSQC